MTDKRIRKQQVLALVVLTTASLGLGIAGYLQGTPQEEATRFYLRNDGGAVLFEHARHGESTGSCVECHHELAMDVYDCGNCHDGPDYTVENADHDELLEIHDRACDGCHQIASPENASSCRDCHLDNLSDVYHRSCNACHLAKTPQRFADESGAPLCRSCHLR